ncbi:LysM peptidoglycan-binding domain-containing protein [Cytobacillus sp. FJAT-54145]|uniref:LysM peptidoglycan-binding domain-containing protein n=1 Tax=Cytobacillus spartinae TaxID=3299023 RepID=A0ABW6K573_9BACI
MTKKLLVLIAIIFIGLSYNQDVLAADELPPEVIKQAISSNTIAYQGNAVPGYTTFTIETNEPTRGYLIAEGNGLSVKINLSTMDYKTTHVVHWVPWNDTKRVPLPAGTYRIKSYLTDQAYNSAQGYPIGQITVVNETNPKQLVSITNTSGAEISPKYSVNEPLTTVSYELSRHAEVQISIQKDDHDIFQTGKVKLAPGIHTFEWNGRNDKGVIVPDGEYNIAFKTIELSYNYPPTSQEIHRLGKITVKNGESSIPEWRMKEMITSASFDSNTVSPNHDGTQDQVSGKVVVAEPINLTVYIATEAGSHMNHVISFQNVQPGTHTFSWNATDWMGGKALNGNYYIKVMATEANGATGYLLIENPVMVTDSHSVKPLQPIKEVRVIAEQTQMSVYPMDQGYKATKGEVFQLVSDKPENGYYQVLVKNTVPAKVKVGDVELVEEVLPPQDVLTNYVNHTVASGDTLWKIAQKYGVTVSGLVKLNSLDINQPLFIGQVIKVSEKVEAPQDAESNVHTVQAGDTLWKIAQKYNVRIDSIVKENNLDVTKPLYIGQTIKIPSSTVVIQPPVTTETIHTVQSGDTLWKIAQKYGVTVQDLLQANQLNTTDFLYIGQKLTIPTKQPVESYVIYTVQSGDTLWKIAQNNRTTIQAIVDLNQLDVTKALWIGQQLKMPK